MKTTTTFAFTKGAGKFFGVILFLMTAISFQNATAQFSINTPPGFTGTTSAGPITVHSSVYLGRGGTGTGTNNNIAIGGNGTLATATDVDANNVGIGYLSLITLGTIGDNNVAIGTGAMQSVTSGNLNTAIGAQSLQAVTGSGSIERNTAFGQAAMSRAASGANNNSAFGVNALAGPLTGSSSGKWNVAMGSAAGYTNTGDSNIFVGGNAGQNHGAGNRNVAIGFGAIVQNGNASYQLNIQNIIYGINNFGTGITPSTGNIGIGVQSPIVKLDIGGELRIGTVNTETPTGQYLYVGTNNIVRRGTLPPAGVTSYCGTVNRIPRTINADGRMDCSQIWDDGVNSVGINAISGFGYTSLSGFQLGSTIPPSSGNFRLLVNGPLSAMSLYAFSDEKLKKDITELKNAIDKIKLLKGVAYNWRVNDFPERDFGPEHQIGFIAQDVEKVVPEAVVKTSDGYYAMNYSSIIPVLTEGIKEQQKMIEELKLEMSELKSRLSKSNVVNPQRSTKDNFQIIPNPIEQEAKIVYNLEDATSKVMFIVYDLQGKTLKQINLPKNTKEGQLPLNKSELGKGMYILSLVVNNEEIQSKKFLVL